MAIIIKYVITEIVMFISNLYLLGGENIVNFMPFIFLPNNFASF